MLPVSLGGILIDVQFINHSDNAGMAGGGEDNKAAHAGLSITWLKKSILLLCYYGCNFLILTTYNKVKTCFKN